MFGFVKFVSSVSFERVATGYLEDKKPQDNSKRTNNDLKVLLSFNFIYKYFNKKF